MPKSKGLNVGGVFVVKATLGVVKQHWAVATTSEMEAVAAVEKQLGPEWTVTLTKRRLTGWRLSLLKLQPDSARKL